MQLVDEVNAKTKDVDLGIKSNASYEIIPIYSYEELHKRYGDNKTGGYGGESKWCHTDKKSTYETWTKDGTQMFFVVQQKKWEKIQAPQQLPDNCYDEYGMSLIAILVDVATNNLLRSTSRWNHAVTPPSGDADEMFESWSQLNKAIGLDVENICKNELAQMRHKLQDEIVNANENVEKILANVNIINNNTIPKKLKLYVTSISIPNSVESIGDRAFKECTSLTSITIPDSVEGIGDWAFHNCTKLISVTIPDSVKSIGDYAFQYCESLTSLTIPDSVERIGANAFCDCEDLINLTFKNKTLDEVKSMSYYPWGIEDESIIKCENIDSINESFENDLMLMLESCNKAFDRQPSFVHSNNETYDEMHENDFAYDVVKKCMRNNMILDGVWSVDNKHHYIASIYGGNNGASLDRHIWVKYLQDVEQMVSQMLENGCGSAWLIDFENDPLDDAWTLRIGFDLMESPFSDDK